jgi:hypothetical protein
MKKSKVIFRDVLIGGSIILFALGEFVLSGDQMVRGVLETVAGIAFLIGLYLWQEIRREKKKQEETKQ